MNFSEALHELKHGGKIRRKVWIGSKHIERNESKNTFLVNWKENRNVLSINRISVESILANDWELYNENI